MTVFVMNMLPTLKMSTLFDVSWGAILCSSTLCSFAGTKVTRNANTEDFIFQLFSWEIQPSTGCSITTTEKHDESAKSSSCVQRSGDNRYINERRAGMNHTTAARYQPRYLNSCNHKGQCLVLVNQLICLGLSFQNDSDLASRKHHLKSLPV